MKGMTIELQKNSLKKKPSVFKRLAAKRTNKTEFHREPAMDPEALKPAPANKSITPPSDPHADTKEKTDIPAQTGKKDKKPAHPKRRLVFRILGLILLVGVVAGGYFVYRSNKALTFMGINTNPSTTIANVINQKEPELDKDEQNRTNILIVGIDTRENDRALQNTDTIMIASFNHTTENTVLISIPRDLMIAYPDNQYYFTKVNAIYNYCERENTGTGLECLAETTQDITGLTIQYYVMMDVAGMIKVIDLLGGIEVDVERAFTDYMFPTVNNTYETIHFDAGLQHMDGETAMKFARSRHAQSIEGSDYYRARRQQKIVIAAVEKALSMDTLKNPVTVIEILEELGNSVTLSEITTEDIRAALNTAEKIAEEHTYTVVLDPALAHWQLISESPAVPKAGAGEWEAINIYLGKLYDHPDLYTTDTSVYIYNAGLGYNETYQQYLAITEAFPYLSIVFGGNSNLQTLTGTQIYNFEAEPTEAVLAEYAELLGADWTSTIPEGLTSIYGEDIAILFGAPEPAVTIENNEETTEAAE